MNYLILFNNFLHDFAAGLLLASAFTIYILYRHLGENPSREQLDYFRRLYRRVGQLAIISFIWIILGGAVRTWFFEEFEWAPAALQNRVPLLLFKHVLIFIAVFLGAYGWYQIHRRVRTLLKP